MVLYSEGAQTGNFIIRVSNLKGHKPPFWINVNLIDTFKTQMNQKKHSFCVAISRKKKDKANQLFLFVVFDHHGCYEFHHGHDMCLIMIMVKILLTFFDFCKIQVPDPA